MTYEIKVQTTSQYLENSDAFVLFKNFSNDREFNSVRALAKCPRRIFCFEALFIPVRTHSFHHLYRDLFFPAFFNRAFRCHGIAIYIFSILIDIFTLPIRLMTLLPRLIYNEMHSKKTHPFYQFLRRNEVKEEDLREDSVILKIKRTAKNKDKQECLISECQELDFIQVPFPCTIPDESTETILRHHVQLPNMQHSPLASDPQDSKDSLSSPSFQSSL